MQRIVLQLKIQRGSLEPLIFDRRPDIAWEEKVWQREETHAGMRGSVKLRRVDKRSASTDAAMSLPTRPSPPAIMPPSRHKGTLP